MMKMIETICHHRVFLLQLLNAELLQEIIRETDTKNPPMCLSKVSETG